MRKRQKKQNMYERLYNDQLEKNGELKKTISNCREQIIGQSKMLAAALEEAQDSFTVALTEEEIIVLDDGDEVAADMLADQVLAQARKRNII